MARSTTWSLRSSAPTLAPAGEQSPCVVRDAIGGHQLAGGHSSWCPELESRTTYAASTSHKTQPPLSPPPPLSLPAPLRLRLETPADQGPRRLMPDSLCVCSLRAKQVLENVTKRMTSARSDEGEADKVDTFRDKERVVRATSLHLSLLLRPPLPRAFACWVQPKVRTAVR